MQQTPINLVILCQHYEASVWEPLLFMLDWLRNKLAGRSFSCQEIGCWLAAEAALEPGSLAKPNKLRLPGLTTSPATAKQVKAT